MSTTHCLSESPVLDTTPGPTPAQHFREHLKILLGRIWLYNLTIGTARPDTLYQHDQLLLALIRLEPTITLAQLARYLNVSAIVLTHRILTLVTNGGSPAHTHLDPDGALQALIAQRATDPEPHCWEAWLWEFLDTASLTTLQELHRTFLKTIASLQPHLPIPTMCVTCTQFSAFHYPTDLVQPHHCRLINQPLLDVDLKVECPEHQVGLSS